MSIDAPYDSLPPRRRKQLNLRRANGGVFGLSYGMSAFGSPLGAITGVQVPTDPPLSTDQFTSVATDTSATQGSGVAGTTGADSGGAAAP